ncbi:MAG TPA: acireductone synthase [Polyangia bacterium]|jgi:enolase-phosphatase E1|nr:acireductone synthase [Polyangia bacterium]
MTPIPTGPAAVLLDIEGTISPISFVKEVMFPVAAAALPAFVAAHAGEPDVEAALDGVRSTALAEDGGQLERQGLVERLLAWIAADRKHPSLKSLQGRIWQTEFEAGRLVAPFYDDVPPMLRRWQGEGRRIAIYSSGSALAQRQFVRYTDHGDLSGLVERYFDLTVGAKQEPASYRAIAAALSLAPERILFLTDSPPEVEAARRAGLRAVQVVRPGTTVLATGTIVRSFDELPALPEMTS